MKKSPAKKQRAISPTMKSYTVSSSKPRFIKKANLNTEQRSERKVFVTTEDIYAMPVQVRAESP